MPVNSTHPDYDANAAAWLRARDVFAGEDAVKAAGERYLPKLDSQSSDEFNAYRARASFFNATARTADGFVGLIFRREPTFKIPDNSAGVGLALAAFVDDADMLGTSLSAYAKNVVTEVVSVIRFQFLHFIKLAFEFIQKTVGHELSNGDPLCGFPLWERS